MEGSIPFDENFLLLYDLCGAALEADEYGRRGSPYVCRAGARLVLSHVFCTWIPDHGTFHDHNPKDRFN